MSNRRKIRTRACGSPLARRIAAAQIELMESTGGVQRYPRAVVCDSCGCDFTNRPDQGGKITGTWAVCPHCAPRHTEKIRAVCPPDQSFGDFVRARRMRAFGHEDLVITIQGSIAGLLETRSGRAQIQYRDAATNELETTTFIEGDS